MEIQASDHWAPRGLREPDEAKLGETPGFLSAEFQETLTQWWLEDSARANTPNWDLASTCRVKDRTGLILVEAKAHEGELSDDRSGARHPRNQKQIEQALREATDGWNALLPGFALSASSHYQLSNRFAFAWKLAQFGTPVVLVYLGFLDVHEMNEGGRTLLIEHTQWRSRVLDESKHTVPKDVWDRTFDVGGTSLTVLIRSAVVDVDARTMADGTN